MNRIIFSVLFCVVFITFTASDISACSCNLLIGSKSLEKQVKESYKQSSAVFIGEVVEIIKKPDVFFVEIKFKVEKTWNNESQKEITITTGQGNGDCGYKFEIGEKYLVYAYGDRNNLGTNICQRTSLSAGNKDIEFLNKVKKSKIKSSPK